MKVDRPSDNTTDWDAIRDLVVFEEPRYIQNSFSVFYPEQRSIDAREKEIFSRIQERYFPARILSPAGSSDPDTPRLLFQSQHGHSQIIVADATITLNVTYSPDWQTKPEEARAYMLERTGYLFDVIEMLGEGVVPLFCGSVTRARLPSRSSDQAIPAFVARVFAREGGEEIHDAIIRITKVVDDLYFSNVTVQNYRTFNLTAPLAPVFRLSRFAAIERGVEVIGDFNTRYAFNQDRPFQVTRQTAAEVLDRNFVMVQEILDQAKEAADELGA